MKISNKLRRNAALSITAGLLILQSATSYAARCEYTIQNEWNTGFVATVRITNDTTTSINGWAVNWTYSDGSTRTGGWNANFSGNNPYSAAGVGWNDKINPGQVIEFGVQGNKGVPNSPASKPVVSGAVCGRQGSSSDAISSRSSSSSSSRVSSKFGCNDHSSCAASTSPSSSSRTSSSALTSSSSSSSSDGRIWDYSSSSSSSSTSSVPNILPVADVKVTTHGLTVYVDTTGSTDADGDALTHHIGFGDYTYFTYPTAWHTYKEPGDYLITVTLGDGKGWGLVTKTQLVSVQAAEGNQAPIARLTTATIYQSLVAHGGSSYDKEGTPLTYEWDFGDGAYVGDASTRINECPTGASSSSSPSLFVGSSSSLRSSQSSIISNSSSVKTSSSVANTQLSTRLVTLTVSDGELKDMAQRTVSVGKCLSSFVDEVPAPRFTYRVEGNTVYVDASDSRDDIGFSWEFGDGAKGVGLKASHTYASSGTYDIRLRVEGAYMFSAYKTISVVVGSGSSVPSTASSSSLSSSSSVVSSSSSSVSSTATSSSISSALSSSSQASSDRNRYTAPRATIAPVIDGVVDSVWNKAVWSPIDVFWLGTQSNPSAQDYSGRYKALWDENYLYILYDITDDKIFDGVRDALDRYWEDDTVELFIDENKNGGQHGYNTSAWAYHVSTYGDTVDSTTGGAKLLNDHIDVRLVSNGNQHYWEMRVRIFGEDYADWKTNTPLTLTAGKLLGFSASYIDNDGSSQRESMMGSVDTQGHKNNQGYLDASVFGSLLLVE